MFKTVDRDLWRDATRDSRVVIGAFCDEFAPFSLGVGLKGRAAWGFDKVPDAFKPLEKRRLLKAGLTGGTKHALRKVSTAWADYQTQTELGLEATEEEIDLKAEEYARECGGWVARLSASKDALKAWLQTYAQNLGVVVGKRWTVDSWAERFKDSTFWKRVLRKQVGRAFEGVYRASGWVHRKGELFCSDQTLNRRIAREARNREILEGLQVVDEQTGESLVLADVAKGSVANPAIRRAELMTRMRGFEEYATAKGHHCLFVTVTTPSAYHRISSAGRRLKAWNETTPRQAHEYLLKVWARVRACWQRADLLIQPYGFRVVEPHHDGTPHWHLVLFAAPDDVNKVSDPIEKEFLRDSPDEKGAQKNRVQVKPIEAKQGGAAAYLAKYVSKNIDGLGTEEFESDEGPKGSIEGAARVLAWASRWGIRQFQQVGGPSVTVWRELRRLREPQQGELFERARKAVDLGQWVDFFAIQGGASVGKKSHKVRLLVDLGEGSKYGEPVRVTKGLQCPDMVTIGMIKTWRLRDYQTRLKRWVIERRSRDRHQAQRVSASTRTGVNNCTPAEASGRFKFFRASGLQRPKGQLMRV